MLLIGYHQIFHWFLSFVIEKRLCETGPRNFIQSICSRAVLCMVSCMKWLYTIYFIKKLDISRHDNRIISVIPQRSIIQRSYREIVLVACHNLGFTAPLIGLKSQYFSWNYILGPSPAKRIWRNVKGSFVCDDTWLHNLHCRVKMNVLINIHIIRWRWSWCDQRKTLIISPSVVGSMVIPIMPDNNT